MKPKKVGVGEDMQSFCLSHKMHVLCVNNCIPGSTVVQLTSPKSNITILQTGNRINLMQKYNLITHSKSQSCNSGILTSTTQPITGKEIYDTI